MGLGLSPKRIGNPEKPKTWFLRTKQGAIDGTPLFYSTFLALTNGHNALRHKMKGWASEGVQVKVG